MDAAENVKELESLVRFYSGSFASDDCFRNKMADSEVLDIAAAMYRARKESLCLTIIRIITPAGQRAKSAFTGMCGLI